MCEISVIAPVYNMESYIGDFLKSIESQAYDDFELILVNDGSSDSSPAIIDQFAAGHEYCKVIHQDNGGVCSARNAGIEAAEGRYLYIVDTDDWLAEDALASISEAIAETGADVLYGQAYVEYDKEHRLETPFPHSFYSEDPHLLKEIQCALNNNNLIYTDDHAVRTISYLGGAPWRAAVKAAVVKDNNVRYKNGLRLGEDILFWQMVFDYVQSVSYTEKPFYHYRIVEGSLSHGFKRDLLNIYQEMINAHEEYLAMTGKDVDYRNAFYFRLIIYIHQSLAYYFMNREYTDSDPYGRFLDFVKSEPYSTAIQSVPLAKLVRLKSRVQLLLLKLKMYRLYWAISKRKQHL